MHHRPHRWFWAAAALSPATVARAAAVGLALVWPSWSAAQQPERPWRLTAAAGLAAQADNQDGHLGRLGSHAAAAVSLRLTPRVALRAEGLVTSFPRAVDHDHSPCFPDSFACHPPTGGVRLQALTLGTVAGRVAGGGYGALGGGVYRLANHPTERGRTRAGVYGALGRELLSGTPALTLEAQLHYVPGLALGGSWSLPVRLGLTF